MSVSSTRLSRVGVTLVAALATVGMAGGRGGRAGRRGLVPIRYSFDWSPDSDWAPVIGPTSSVTSQMQGVSVEYVPGDPTLIELLASHQLDIAQVPGPLAVQGHAEGLPFTVVGVQLPESPLVILADADKGIDDAEGPRGQVGGGPGR